MQAHETPEAADNDSRTQAFSFSSEQKQSPTILRVQKGLSRVCKFRVLGLVVTYYFSDKTPHPSLKYYFGLG